MPIPSTGPIRFSSLRSEIKDTNTGSVRLSELYYGSSFLPKNRAVVSPMKDLPTNTTQTRSVSSYREVYKYSAHQITISSNVNNYNLRSNVGAGITIPMMVDVTISPNVIIGGGWFIDVRAFDSPNGTGTTNIESYKVGTRVYRSRAGGCPIGFKWVYVGTITEINRNFNTFRIQYDPQIYSPINLSDNNGINNRAHIYDNVRILNPLNRDLYVKLSTDVLGNNQLFVKDAYPSPAFEIKNFPDYSSIFIDNKGTIIGRGGVGGRGGLNLASIGDGEAGENGGIGIRVMGSVNNVSSDTTISCGISTNTQSIFAGGGGGSGGGADSDAGNIVPIDGAGGGGGGGAGVPPGLGNAGGYMCLFTNGYPGLAGNDGTIVKIGNGTTYNYGTGGSGGASTNNVGGRGGSLNGTGTTGFNLFAGPTSFNQGEEGKAGLAIEGRVTFTNFTIPNVAISPSIRI